MSMASHLRQIDGGADQQEVIEQAGGFADSRRRI
jgi:hypothetical protein